MFQVFTRHESRSRFDVGIVRSAFDPTTPNPEHEPGTGNAEE